MARNSITYSFLPGESLWQVASNAQNVQSVPQCAGHELGSTKLAKACADFLAKNEKAQIQWMLERDFAEFEKAV